MPFVCHLHFMWHLPVLLSAFSVHHFFLANIFLPTLTKLLDSTTKSLFLFLWLPLSLPAHFSCSLSFIWNILLISQSLFQLLCKCQTKVFLFNLHLLVHCSALIFVIFLTTVQCCLVTLLPATTLQSLISFR